MLKTITAAKQMIENDYRIECGRCYSIRAMVATPQESKLLRKICLDAAIFGE